jgi:hypothetical protein
MERFERHQKRMRKCGFDRALAELRDPQIVVVLSALRAGLASMSRSVSVGG